jgi:hypothetical protein
LSKHNQILFKYCQLLLISGKILEKKGFDVFDIEVDTQEVDEFVQTVKNIAPTFGGINLEDISAPRCFEIEQRLIAKSSRVSRGLCEETINFPGRFP